MTSNLFTSTFAPLGKLIYEKKAVRKAVVILSIVSLLLGILLFVYVYLQDRGQIKEYLNEAFPFFLIIPGAFLFSILSYLASTYKGKLDVELEKIHGERTELTNKIEEEKDKHIFNTIQLSLNHLTEYYSINKAQARSSFGFSIFAIVIGLATIIAGIWMFYFKTNPDVNLTIITGIAGLLLEFIGGAYFFMYKKSLEQVNFFFGQLIKIQDTMLSIDLSKNIGAKEKEIEMTEKIITSLLERSLK